MPFSTKFIMPYLPFSTKFIMPYLPFSTIFSSSLLRTNLLERYKYFRQYRKDALLLTVLTYNVGHGSLLAMANTRRVSSSGKSSSATGIFTKSTYRTIATKASIKLVNGRDCAFGTYRTIATKASLSPASNTAEKKSFNCYISRSRYLKSLPLSNREKGLIVSF